MLSCRRNRPPGTPALPSGPSTGLKDTAYTFTTIATDPDGDGISYRFDWGDGDTSDWTDWVPSGRPAGASHAWLEAGTFAVRVEARDAHDALSPWSDPHDITIISRTPHTPEMPSGPEQGRPRRTYSFESSAADPDKDPVSLRFAWGDGDTSDWSGFVPSGTPVTMSHAWTDTATYSVSAQAMNSDSLLSDWSLTSEISIGYHPPGRASGPVGPWEGGVNIPHTFWSRATDPDGDSVSLRFAWGDGDTSAWSEPVRSGDTVRMQHVWTEARTHYIRAQARSMERVESAWSTSRRFDALQAKWWFPTGDYVSSSPAIGPDGTIYVGSDGLYAVNPDGSFRWWYDTDHAWVRSSPAIGPDGTVYVGAEGLYAINPDGTLNWRYETGSFVWSSPAIGADGTVYVGSGQNLHALRPDGTLSWRFRTENTVASPPAVGTDGTLYFGSNDGYVYAVNPDGTLNWRYETGGWVTSSPAIGADGTVHTGSYDGRLYALNPDGTLNWSFAVGTRISSSPTIGPDGTIYIGSNDGHLYAVNPGGTLKWRFATEDWVRSTPAIAADGTIYVGSDDYNLYAVSPDGTLLWEFATFDWVYSSPAIGPDGTIYVGSWDGYLYGVQGTSPLAESPWPKFRHNNRNTGRAGGRR